MSKTVKSDENQREMDDVYNVSLQSLLISRKPPGEPLFRKWKTVKSSEFGVSGIDVYT